MREIHSQLCGDRFRAHLPPKSSEIVEQGLFFCLEGYQCQIYTDVYEVRDTEEGYYAQLERSVAEGD
jgi:hypothetical protein